MAKSIYDLDNEGGLEIIGGSANTQAALKINNNAAGYSALSVLSTASGAAVQISGIQGIGLDVDAKDATAVAGDFRSNATAGNAVIIGKTVNSSITVASLKFLGTSVASAAIMQFAGGFISCTSIILTSVAHTDYALPVVVGGEVRYIPLVKGAALIGGAAF